MQQISARRNLSYLLDTAESKENSAVCVVCKTSGGVARSCTLCTRPLHHFCSHEVCIQAGIRDENGVLLQDFGEECFCSVSCFKNSRKSMTALLQEEPANIHAFVDVNNTRSCVVCGEILQDRHVCDQCKEPLHPKCADEVWISLNSSESRGNSFLCSASCHRVASNLTNDDRYLGKMVAFSPTEETWMKHERYREVGSTYLSGTISRKISSKDKTTKATIIFYELRWGISTFSGKEFVHNLTETLVLKGLAKYAKLIGHNILGETWRRLCEPEASKVCFDPLEEENYEELDETMVRYQVNENKPQDLQEVETIQSIQFSTTAHMDEPPDLFTHPDGTHGPRIKDKYKHIFERSASSCFFAYLPVSFWRRVVESTNQHASQQKKNPVTLEELMKFFGILFYMTLVDRGEYKNYWGAQVEDLIFGNSDAKERFGMERVMPLSRFKFIRKHLSFRPVVPAEHLKVDPAARIRPLITMLKLRSPKYVDIGRNCAVDEASVACRSKFARHLIVYNSSKPTGTLLYCFLIFLLIALMFLLRKIPF